MFDIKKIALLLSLVLCVSCGKSKYFPLFENYDPPIVVRECKYMFAFLAQLDDEYEIIRSGYYFQNPEYDKLKAEKLALRVCLTSFNKEMLESLQGEGGPDLRVTYVTESDPIIDKQIREASVKVAMGEWLEYRLEGLVKLKITCNKRIFGRDTGNDLSDKFLTFNNTNHLQLWITQDKEYKGLVPLRMPVSKYMSSRPLASEESLFLLGERPSELNQSSLSCIFTIEIQLDNGVKFRESTPAVTLI